MTIYKRIDSKIGLAVTIGIILLFLSCSNSDEIVVDKDRIYFNVIVNDTLIKNGEVAYYGDLLDDKKIIKFEVYNDLGYLREQIRIRNIDLKTGKVPLYFEERGSEQPVLPTAYFDLAYGDGDVFGEGYDVLEDKDFENYIIIDAISSDSTKIRGSFQIKLKLSEKSVDLTEQSIYGNVIVLSQGEFYLKKI
ncbi:hypothetical protein [Flagellimonas sp. 2504JD1-5]